MESRYEVLGQLVRAHAATVLRARRRSDSSPVLLKIRNETPPFRALAARQESDLLQHLSLAAGPRVVEAVDTSEGGYLVLEDAGLMPLADAIRDRGLDLPFFFQCGIHLAGVLESLHDRDVVLGLIEPSGILVNADGTRVQLFEFGVSWRVGRQPQGTFATAYTAPERTGRINRAADHRSDLYSLGTVFYELLVGAAAFSAQDPLELVHAHIARTPPPPAAIVAGIPETVSALVMKLLAKAPEDRYQSARGLRHDLERCSREWAAGGSIAPFELGARDLSSRFQIPERLYGRTRERQVLLDAFTSTCEGHTTVVLVSGYAGAGKTSLIGELWRPGTRERGYFASGKFDQVVRNIPYGAILEAFRGLVWQLLADHEQRVRLVRERLSEALGGSGSVLAEVIPDIELVLGAQTPSPALNPVDAQNRFRYVFQAFVRTLGGREHPLVLFLDDLQWADSATLGLLHALATGPAISHLMLICAYRDNEVDAEHPVTAAVRQLKSAGASVRELTLAPLALPDLVLLLRDTLRGDAGEMESLARLVQSKTDGNPFFVRQFLETLAQEGLFRFDQARDRWIFDLREIAQASTTGNVIDLMTQRIQRLSAVAQKAATLAACMGNRFEWETFLTVAREPEAAAAAALGEVLEAGLIQVAGGVEGQTASPTRYSFIHDRVQQAAYGLIPEDRREPLHLEVGRLLRARSDAGTPDERLFEVVNHLNLGRRLIDAPVERLELARLNLAAARKAKTSTAYETAASYVDAGLDLLPSSSWQSEYDLTADLHLEALETHYLAGHFEAAERFFGRLERPEVRMFDRGRAYCLRIVLFENLSRWDDAIRSGLDGLALFGIVFPEDVAGKEALLEREVEAAERARGGRTISSLVDLPAMTDPHMSLAMRILTHLWAPVYISGDHVMARIISVTMVRLSLTHGNTADSAYGYVTHAITVGPVRGEYAAAYEWGGLALAVNDRFDDRRLRAKIHQQFQAHVNPWRRPFETCVPHAREAQQSGLQAGDFTYAAYGAVTESWPAFFGGRDLGRFVEEFTPTLALLDRIHMSEFGVVLQVLLNWALALQGRTADRLSLSAGAFDEDALIARYERSSPFIVMFFHAARLHLALVFGAHERALEAARSARAVAQIGTVWPVLIDVWAALAMAAHAERVSSEERRGYDAHLYATRDLLRDLSNHCAENFQGWFLLLSGEIARLEGHLPEAAMYFDEAIEHARRLENRQLEAMGHELCGRLWLYRDQPLVARAFMHDACRTYAALGATAKVDDIVERFRTLWAHRGETVPPATSDALGSAARSLDMATVVKMTNAIGAEIEVGGLLRTLMLLALENAGAERGAFVQESDGTLMVGAEASADPAQVAVGQRVPLDRAASLSQGVVRYVRRTGQPVVIGDATRDERFGGDEYVLRERPKSILCVPVEHQGRRSGVLYLENNLSAHTFTPDRIEMMRILATQAAISLENARLYHEMKGEVTRRTAAEEALREAVAELEALKNRLEAENVYLQEEIRTDHNFNEIVGNSPALLEALRQVERVAPTDTTVLIVGETGSGKELFARAVHNRSRRNQRPLVKVNCGAIAPGLVESELFGHTKGAFTGAIDRRVGRFELANGGTIFLDEVGELPLEAQVKLLRVLQEQEFEPVGSSRTIHVSVRVIAATNRNLEQAVREGRFRADLLYRLNVFPIEVPPLRHRSTDIPLLAGFFVGRAARNLGKPIQGFSARAMERLVGYAWPGNVRELQNLVERAAILAEGAVVDLDGTFLAGPAAPPAAAPVATGPIAHTLEDVQRRHILSVLDATGGVIEGTRGAANVLGMHPNTLRSRMKKLGISTAAGLQHHRPGHA
jgi:predicted ATPase